MRRLVLIMLLVVPMLASAAEGEWRLSLRQDACFAFLHVRPANRQTTGIAFFAGLALTDSNPILRDRIPPGEARFGLQVQLLPPYHQRSQPMDIVSFEVSNGENRTTFQAVTSPLYKDMPVYQLSGNKALEFWNALKNDYPVTIHYMLADKTTRNIPLPLYSIARVKEAINQCAINQP